MRIITKLLAGFAAIIAFFQDHVVAGTYGTPRIIQQVERIQLVEPTLAPMAHIRFCMAYPEDCRGQGKTEGNRPVSMTMKRWVDLATVNADVNAAIRPEANLQGLAGEKWIISPAAGDCNDYAVTKRHELLKRGWPSSALLLAEVVMPSGGHHLILVARTSSGDLLLDNLSPMVRPWTQARYQWVRIQSPANPAFWMVASSKGIV